MALRRKAAEVPLDVSKLTHLALPFNRVELHVPHFDTHVPRQPQRISKRSDSDSDA